MAETRDSRFSVVARSFIWAAGWAIGVALGVALGAYLTATSGVGAPGVESLDTKELVRLPLVSAGTVFGVALLGYLIFFTRRRAAKVDRDPDTGQH